MSKVILKSSKKRPGLWWVRKGVLKNRYFDTWSEALKYALTLLSILLLLCLPAHGRASVDRKYVSETVAELKDAALLVGRYQHDHHGTEADTLWIQRAEADISAAQGALKSYRHRHCSREDVETVMSQLSRDLEDKPPVIAPAELPDERTA